VVKVLLSFVVVCVFSVERLFNQLVKSQHPALEPLIVTKRAEMSINRNYLFDPRALYSLFYIHGYVIYNNSSDVMVWLKKALVRYHSINTPQTHMVKKAS